jgi:hypothetical protein
MSESLDEFITQTERASLANLCSRLNCGVDEYVKGVVDVINHSMPRHYEIIENAREKYAISVPRELLNHTPLQTTEDFLKFNRRGALVERDFAVQAIVNRLTRVPDDRIAYEYLNELAVRLTGIARPDSRNPSELGATLRAIPFVSTYDHDFNSMVYFGQTNRQIPIIHHYQYLTGLVLACCWWLSLYGLKVSSTGENMAILPTAIRNEPARLDLILQGLSDLLQFLPRVYTHYPPFFKQNPATTFGGTSLWMGATQYVWLHEFAHILLAHETEPAAIQQEKDADLLAFEYLLDPKDPFEALKAAGVDIPLWLMMILENRGPKVTPSETHPSAYDRLIAAAKFLGDHVKDGQFYLSLMKLCEPLALVFKYARDPKSRPTRPEIISRINNGPFSSKGLPVRLFVDLIPSQEITEPPMLSFVLRIDTSLDSREKTAPKYWSWLRHKIKLLAGNGVFPFRGVVIVRVHDSWIQFTLSQGDVAVMNRSARAIHTAIIKGEIHGNEGAIGETVRWNMIQQAELESRMKELINDHVELSSYSPSP